VFRVTIKAAAPCSAHAQIALSFGSGDTSLFLANIHELCLFTQQVDDLADEMPSYAQPRKNSFVFRKNLFRHEPDEGSMLKPITKK
jgi:hypothetical protein